MRDAQIRDWVSQLAASLGGPQPLADARELERLFAARDYTGMLRSVRAKLRLNMPVVLGLVNSGGLASSNGIPTPAWIESERPPPPFGTRAFAEFKVTVYVRRTFIAENAFGTLAIAFAHELCHVLLDAIGHPLKEQEEAVDLASMLLGFRALVAEYSTRLERERVGWRGFREALLSGRLPTFESDVKVVHYGYLSPKEIRYALSLMGE